MIPSVLDTFSIQGPNGNHICLVTSPARISLSEIKNASWISLFQLSVARALIAQLVTVIRYTHSEGLVHEDLHCGNVLLQLSHKFNRLSPDELYERFGKPMLEPVNRLDGQELPPGVPQHGILPIWLGKASEKITLPEAKILLSDFGESYSPAAQEKRFESHTPLLIRPPETRFEPTKSLSFSSDIWTLACTIFHIIAQRTLFEGMFTNEDDMTHQQVAALGALPTEWQERWDAQQTNSTKDGELMNQTHAQYQSLDDLFETKVQNPRIEAGMVPLVPAEREAICSMLRSMLSFRPEDRPSAQQVLESDWMVRWGLPAYEKIRSTQ